nr:integrase, catalytic region, zinc finger, CCHC-type, peptidase aspartic, catalytic [Tanacetum cinerariifolium]
MTVRVFMKRSGSGSSDKCGIFGNSLKPWEIIRECSCSCVDGILVDGVSRLIDVDTGDSVVSIVLGAAATETVETTIVGGLNKGKYHGEYILQSIDEGPFKMVRCRDEIASGSELTKDDCESQLYDEFKHFWQHKGENIYDYCVWFTKLINDMRHIKMTMHKIQLNSKFINNMLPKWGRFVMAVKLNRGLKESNHDQLYAYLKQHELHANKNKMLMQRLNQRSHDPLALVSNVSPYQYPSSSSVPLQPSYISPVTYQP